MEVMYVRSLFLMMKTRSFAIIEVAYFYYENRRSFGQNGSNIFRYQNIWTYKHNRSKQLYFEENYSLRKNHEKSFCIWWLGVSDQRIIACCKICDILEFTIIISMIKMCFSIISSIIKGWHSCQFFEIWIRETICLFSNSTRGTNIVDSEGEKFWISRSLDRWKMII